jgi:hypothetical protein
VQQQKQCITRHNAQAEHKLISPNCAHEQDMNLKNETLNCAHEQDVEQDRLHGVEPHKASKALVVDDASVDAQEHHKPAHWISAQCTAMFKVMLRTKFIVIFWG